MHDETDLWAGLADKFTDEAYASVKGYVRTYVMHQQLLEHLPPAPASVLDVGGGAGHQSFPLAQAGYDVTLLDSSPAMLDKARQRLERLPAEVQDRVTLVQADGAQARDATDGRGFDAVLCHGVLGYLDRPEPMVEQLCACAADAGIVSIMTANAHAAAVRPALERRWEDALASFDARTEIGVLGVPGRADTVEELSELLRGNGVEPVRWYGVWLFVDWLEFGGATLDATDVAQMRATAAAELGAARRDPYRQLSRVFHLLGRKGPGLTAAAEVSGGDSAGEAAAMGDYLLQIHHADHDEPITIKLGDCGPDEAEIERQALAKQIEHAAEIDAPLLYPQSDGAGEPGPAIALDPGRVTRVDLVDAAEAEAGL